LTKLTTKLCSLKSAKILKYTGRHL